MQWQEFRPHIRHLPAKDVHRIEQAFQLGQKMHGQQKRESGEPYFHHPIAVAHMLSDLGADADTLIAALLHDTVEDTPITLQEIDRQFDGAVAVLIDGVTKLSAEDVAMSPKLDEQIETLRKIFTLMQQDVRIMVIKLIDRLHNMQTVEFLPPERQRLLSKETIEVFVKIADKLCMQDTRDELEALCLAVLEPETHAALLKLRNTNEQCGTSVIEQIRSSLRTDDRFLNFKTDLVFEHKTWDQMKAQLNAGGSVATGISFIAVAFICEDIDACYRTLGALHQRWKREVLSFQDFINSPQFNGYRGLHTTIIAHDGTRVRCKIRTKEMHHYARQGVTTVCFEETTKIAEILPWTQHLSSLTTDTEDSSDDFWESLKSDILGDSIIIHGPDDSIVQLPRVSTALDGAFYLLKEEALKTKQIKVNGKEVPLSILLTNAASIDIVLDTHETWTRDWLKEVQTGFAAARIRGALMLQSRAQKLALGREMLQRIFTERRHGFIEEFDEKKLQKQLNLLGYSTMNDIYISIADGRLEPTDVYESLFEAPRHTYKSKSPPSLIRYILDMDSVELMDRLNLVHRMHGTELEDIHYHRLGNGSSEATLRVRMNAQSLDAFQQAIAAAGGEHVEIKHLPRTRHLMIIIALVLLWGFDPVFSKMILSHGVGSSLFTFIRAWSVLLFALVLLLLKGGQHALVRIPLHHGSLWIAGIALFCINLFTYKFLQDGSPILYNTILRANAIIMVLPLIIQPRWSQWVLLSTLLGVTGLAFLFSGPFTGSNLLLGIGILVVFNLYTRETSRFQSVARVQARYIQLFASISFISAILSLSLLIFRQLEIPASVFAVVLTAAYSMCFVGLPYIIFHAITDNFGYASLSPWINASVFVTVIAQIVLLGDTRGLQYLIPAAFLLSMASLMASRLQQRIE